MKIKEKLLNFLLTIIVIVLLAVIGIILFLIYGEITGETIFETDILTEFGFANLENNKQNSDIIDVDTSIDKGLTTNIQENRYRNLYNQLNNDSKIIYDKLYANRENLKTGTYRIEFGNTFSETLAKENGSEELQKSYQAAIEALVYENPEIFYIELTNMYLNIETITKIMGKKYNVYVNQGNATNYLTEGFETKEDVDIACQEIEQLKNSIVVKLNGKTDYEKIKAIHDYLVDTIEYDETINKNNIYNIYGALIEKTCVCEGYAKAYQYLMNELGIENVIVIGVATNSNNETENHAWNYVKLDGNWYAVDITWDDPVIIGNGIASSTLKHRYFLKGSNIFNKNHTSSGQFTDGGKEFSYPTLSIEDYK